MCTKKCRLGNEKITPIDDIANGECFGFSYSATIVFKNNENDILTLCSTVDMRETGFSPSKFCIFLKTTTNKNDMVLSSNFRKEQDAMFLDLIEIKDISLRGRGLGTIILSTWLTLLPEYSKLYNISFSKIEASVGSGNNFTPRFAKKLYRKFNNYKYTQTQRLRLNKSELKHGRLVYMIESVDY